MKDFNWAIYISAFRKHFHALMPEIPWQLTSNATEVIAQLLPSLSTEYETRDGVAIHMSAIVESSVVLKAPVIIGPDCFVAATCYLRGGVFLIGQNSIGPSCEIKSSFLFPHSNLAHFNFIGDSVIGSNVNFEAGSIVANHFNERADKKIAVILNGKTVATQVVKFGALVGDDSKIGANAVLSPGTILKPNSIVKRLELVNQLG